VNPLHIAIDEAHKAFKKGEVPIGAVIVRNGKVISRAHNLRERKQNAIYHAEILAIIRACKKLKSWRLDDCEMYVTLEPCQMCMGAITNARLKSVYFGAKSQSDLNWKTDCMNLQDKECSQILKDFFSRARK
jgi:tRNA(adenine34) deaminase